MVFFKSSNNFKVIFGKSNIIGVPNMNYVMIQRRFIRYLTYKINISSPHRCKSLQFLSSGFELSYPNQGGSFFGLLTLYDSDLLRTVVERESQVQVTSRK